jgi:hypothetical protein
MKTTTKRQYNSNGQTNPPSPNEKKKLDNKITPQKKGSERIEQKLMEIDEKEHTVTPQYGQDDWCASRQRCINKKGQASKQHQCSQCAYDVHKECCEIEIINDIEILTCAWCNELEDLQVQYGSGQDRNHNDTHNSESTDDESNYGKQLRCEEEIIFQQDNKEKNDG